MQRGKKKGTKHYLILDDDSMSGLATQVDNALEQGAECVGGVCIVQSTWENERKGYQESATTYYQAILI